jgi:gliding motility-associated-like protein
MGKKVIAVILFTLIASLAYPQNVVTLAGQSGISGSANGNGTAASFDSPHGIACDAVGNVYVADKDNHLIRKITPAGMVSTFAGSGLPGSTDGSATNASFFEPWGIAIDQNGNLYVADTKNYKIRKITPAGVVSTLAGTGVSGVTDGPALNAQFGFPTGIAVDAAGNIYVSEYMTHTIRKVSNGAVSTFAGTAFQSGDVNGTGSAARFNHPHSLAIDQAGNLYVADAWNNKIKKITSAAVVTTVAGSTAGFANGTTSAAKFDNPMGVCVDDNGNIYVGDVNNFCLRKISNGSVTTFAGTPGSAGAVNGQLLQAKFNSPTCIGFYNAGKFFIGDEGNELIRMIDLSSTALPLTLSTANNINTFCQGFNITATALPQGLNSYTLKEGTTVLATNTTGVFSLSGLSPGVHYLSCIASGAAGSYATTTPLQVQVVTGTSAAVTPAGPITLCNGGSTTLTASPGSAYSWSNGATTQSITVNQSGIYAVTITYPGGCTSQSNPVTVNSGGNFTATISPSVAQQICPGDSVLLTASAGVSYLWSNGKTTSSIYAVNAGSYSVTITNSQGCTAISAPVAVSHKPMPTAIQATSDTACTGGTVVLEIVPQTGVTYSWFEQNLGGTALATGNSFITPPLAESTTYYVTIQANGCTGLVRFPVMAVIRAVVAVDFGSQAAQKADGGYAVNFQNKTPQGNYSYMWNFGDGSATATSTDENPTHIYNSEGDYQVTLKVTDAFGCENSISKMVNVTVDHDLFLPSAFTPNYDGVNDVFRLKGSGYLSADMIILDQWGQVMFRTDNASRGWDGTVKGNIAPNGTYSYIVRLKMSDGQNKVMKGNISLIK